MRIFFCGAPGVGKSTLLKELHKLYPEYIVHDSMSALFMDRQEQQFTDSFQNKVNVYCFNIFLNSGDNIIMSRSIIDSLALNTKPKDLEYIESLVPYAIRKTDVFIYLPIEFEISQREDGLRVLDKVYQSYIDKRIRTELRLRIPDFQAFTVTGSIEERVERLKKIFKYDPLTK